MSTLCAKKHDVSTDPRPERVPQPLASGSDHPVSQRSWRALLSAPRTSGGIAPLVGGGGGADGIGDCGVWAWGGLIDEADDPAGEVDGASRLASIPITMPIPPSNSEPT